MDDNAEIAVDNVIEPSVASEKMLSTSQVNDIVKREKIRAAERVRQELEAKHRAEMEQLSGSPQPGAGLDVEAIKQQVYDKFLDDLETHRDAAEKEAQERQMKSLADQYWLKMGKGSELFNDFNEVVGDFEPDKFSSTVHLATQMDNTADIIYELSKNPSKLIQIDSLARQSPKLAMKELQRLSDSISKNIDAKMNNVEAPAPLSRLKPSTAGADNGKMGLKDFKAAPWLRG